MRTNALVLGLAQTLPQTRREYDSAQRLLLAGERTSQAVIKSYHVQVRIKGFPPQTKTFASKTMAKQWAAMVETELKFRLPPGRSDAVLLASVRRCSSVPLARRSNTAIASSRPTCSRRP